MYTYTSMGVDIFRCRDKGLPRNSIDQTVRAWQVLSFSFAGLTSSLVTIGSWEHPCRQVLPEIHTLLQGSDSCFMCFLWRVSGVD